ncbi:hypothetical protein B0H66DRAFT_145973 [Apodospora peruviana]|uniref:Glucan 1, 4-alpha-glucosidase n=1 Tax=Apodospora peruviana TaxID=516989 RepID=A0AAE0MBX2_9PEZI|nr:hypothetical protein B0H66DRAFT_145973 [Apodospora peruviana]
MEDPWGSPWTTTEADKDPRPPSPAKSDLEPPPRALLSVSNSPRINAVSGQSPWADEENDGFGEWAAPDTPAQAPSGSQSGWGGAWTSPSPNLTPLPRGDEFGKASPIAWPDSIAIPNPPNGSALRQPSPDPWAADFSSQALSNDEPATPRPIIDSVSTDDVFGGPLPRTASIIITNDWNDEEIYVGEKEIDVRPNLGPAPAMFPHDDRNDEQAPPEERDHGSTADGPMRPSIEEPTRARVSYSPPPSEHYDDDDATDHEDERSDSPITSIDEDSRARQQVARKTSGKVQELVYKFDGLARAASQEPPVVSRERSKSRSDLDQTSDSDNAGDFRDFEDADEEDPPLPSTPEVTKATPHQEVQQSPVSSNATGVASSPLSRKTTSIDLERPAGTQFGPTAFEVDVGLVEKLWGPIRSDLIADVLRDESELSDRIITDSFTEISERKTWYRISRLGSSRKHNAGDDENYRRVTWQTSTIRQDTIKVVRRWMEEDSIAGRANLGGGTSKQQRNMFGWDSSVEPVGLDAVFGKKKAHSRASSLQSSQKAALPAPGLDPLNPTRKSSASLQGPAQRPSSMAIPAPGSFGWSTGSPTAQTEPTPFMPLSQPPLKVETSTPKQPPPPSTAASHLGAAKSSAQQLFPASSRPLASVPERIASERLAARASLSLAGPPAIQDDDDDDWGEMISSPSETKPSTNGFPDLSDAFSAPPATLTTTQASPGSVPIGPGAPAPRPSIKPPKPPAAVSHKEDGWASVDFSVFEAPAERTKPAVITKQVPTQFNPSAMTPTPFTPTNHTDALSLLTTSAQSPALGGRPVAKAEFTPTTPLPISSPIVLPPSVGTDSSAPLPMSQRKQAAGDDPAALRIIANLPDLSYMLR